MIKQKRRKLRVNVLKRKIKKIGFASYSRKSRLRLLKRFCHRLYVRTQHNNLLFATVDPLKRANYFSSVGQMVDYKHKKKKKNVHGRF